MVSSPQHLRFILHPTPETLIISKYYLSSHSKHKNMKVRYFLLAIIIAGAGWLSGCKVGEDSDMAQIKELKDSVLHRYATTGSVLIHIEEHTAIHIVVGDMALYKGSDGRKESVAAEMVSIVNAIFGKNTRLQSGKLTITKDIANSNENPVDGIDIPLKMTATH